VLITYTTNKNGGRSGEYRTPNNFYKNMFYSGESKIGKIVVLFNEGSASASECLLGAMLDYGTCDNTIGVISYGKGIMQSYFGYPDNPNREPLFIIKLTTAYVHWPVSGKCIQTGYKGQAGGITPDEIVENGLFYPEIADKYANDLQVQAALSFISLP
ncbi:MAG: S41 family peptidase, partial [Firmicutes bacterium]|nr:S41 family peptidase [Bacillota bacterium]